MEKRDATDLTDAQWELVKPHVHADRDRPAVGGPPGGRQRDPGLAADGLPVADAAEGAAVLDGAFPLLALETQRRPGPAARGTAGREADAAGPRPIVLTGLGLLDFPEDEVAAVVERLVVAGPLPEKARGDAAHVAIAALNGADILLTWNCTPLANAALRGRIEEILSDSGLGPVTISTPWDLTEPADA